MQTIDINQIALSQQNMRQNVDDGDDGDTDVATLAQSIKSQGLLNPILVRPVSQNRYEVYAGHRRLLAAKQLKWDSIPCIVSEINDRDAKVRSLIENYQRRDNTYEEKIKTFGDLYQNECNRDLKQLCQTVGTKTATLKRYLRLGALPASILELLDRRDGEKRMTLKNAELLVDLDAQLRQDLVDQIVKAELSNMETEAVIRQFQKDSDLDKVPDFINKAIEDSAKKRTQKRAKKENEKPKVKEAQEVENSDIEDDEDDPTPKQKEAKPKQEQEDDSDDLVGDPMDEKVNKSRQPWLYNPNDKLKRPRSIPEKHLKAFWDVYEKIDQKVLAV